MSSCKRFALGSAVALALASVGCSMESDSRSQAASGTIYDIGFETRPSYIPSNVVVLTFDDGPDWNNTKRVLDTLQAKQVKASFFINTKNWSDVDLDAPMQDLVRRMANEGHELASHSVHHNHLATLSAAQVEAEIAGVESTVSTVLGAGAPRLTLFRAPFGEPYQDGAPGSPGYDLVAPVVAGHAVHIGWQIDSYDYNCAGNAQCVIDNVKNALASGSYGIILMHSVHAQTADALPALIDYLRGAGYQFWTVEDVVRAKYGKSSGELIDGATPDPDPDPPTDPDPDPEDPPSGDCDAPPFSSDETYGWGDRVEVGGEIYECKPWPFSGWCDAGAAYEPGTGWAWQDAWTLIGECDGGGEPDPDPDPDPPTDPDPEDPDDGDWNAANLTWFTSYPEPGSEECEEFNGCQWAGYFAFLDQQMPEEWVASHNIAAVHSNVSSQYALKTLRLRQDGREIDVVVYDECSDSDCDGCCTQNSSETGFLIDIESYTRDRFGSGDGIVEWRCLDCD